MSNQTNTKAGVDFGAEYNEQAWILAPAAARLLGIKTGTLSKWRQHGKGPKGWVQTSRTTVHYPLSEVMKFLSGWAGSSNR